MPRNGSGVYSLPGTYEAVSGEVIEAQQHNDPLEDLESDANTVRPIVAGGTGASSASTALDNLTKRSSALASAATVNIGAAAGRLIHITGTTTITAFDSVTAGIERELVFDGALTLTHNATSLIIPGAANITTAAGDIAVLVSEGSGNWRVANYQPYAIAPRMTGLGTAASLTSGSQVDFTIPSWARWIEINFHNVSATASGNFLVQLGGSGGIETSGYSGSVNVGGTPALLSASFILMGTSGATAVVSGSIRLSAIASDTWVATWQTGFSNSAGNNNGAGSKVISAGALTTVRFSTNGTAFDSGNVNVLYGG